MEDNKAYLEGVREWFDEGIGNRDYVLCQGLILRLRIEGFDTEAKQLHNELMEATLGDFLVESNLD